jgi:hypothetical protein
MIKDSYGFIGSLYPPATLALKMAKLRLIENYKCEGDDRA